MGKSRFLVVFDGAQKNSALDDYLVVEGGRLIKDKNYGREWFRTYRFESQDSYVFLHGSVHVIDPRVFHGKSPVTTIIDVKMREQDAGKGSMSGVHRVIGYYNIKDEGIEARLRYALSRLAL